MSRPVTALLLILVIAACGGPSATSTRTLQPTSQATTTPDTTGTVSGALTPEQLCGFLPPSDWHQFNYVTTAEPEVSSDAEGTATCQYASTLSFEIYTHDTPAEAEETYDTIIENAPFDAGEAVTVAGADEAEIDMEITDETSGIVVRTGRVAFTIGGPARDEAREQLETIAEAVAQRVASIR